MKQVDLIIIGGGSAGMSAALQARKQGIKEILMLERKEELGGILQQCIHNGFGLQVFKEELSGPMYAQRFMEQIERQAIDYRLCTTVLEVTKDKEVFYVNEIEGYVWVKAKAIIFACGCYERNRGAIQIPGKRLPGVYTAGSAQRFLNIENILVGKKVFILGSGDIGLIMARRLTLEGAEVVGVAEIMPYSNGLTRNLVQCLKDFDIPLYLSHTVVNIQGDKHVEQIVLAQVDEHRQSIKESEKIIEVDTLLLSIGLIPDISLAASMNMEIDGRTKGAMVNERYETNIPHIYACGNALHVHDVVDFVTLEAAACADYVSQDILNGIRSERELATIFSDTIAYVLPQYISKNPKQDITLSFRVKQPMKNCEIIIRNDNKILRRIKKRILLPAEMERIVLKQEDLKELQSLYVEVEV